MGNNERILKYGWSEFLKTPFSLLFFVLCLVVTYLVYADKKQSQKDKEKYEEQARACNEERLKDKEIYINLLENLKINREFKKDSIK